MLAHCRWKVDQGIPCLPLLQSLTSKVCSALPPLRVLLRPGADGLPISELRTEASRRDPVASRSPWVIQLGLNGSSGLKVYVTCYNTIKQPRIEIRNTSLRNSTVLLWFPIGLCASGISEGERVVERKQGALGLLPYVVTTTPQFLKDVTNSNIVILKPVLNQKTGHTEHTAVQSGGFQNKERLGD